MAFAEIAALHSKEPLSLALTHVARIPAKPAFLSGLMRLALPSHTGRKKFQRQQGAASKSNSFSSCGSFSGY